MKDEKQNGSAAQGAVESPKLLTVDKVEEMLKRDLHACMLMLQSVHDDVDTLKMLAVALHGKYMNHKHKEELERQTKLGV